MVCRCLSARPLFYIGHVFDRLKTMGRALTRELRVYQLAMRHPGTPRVVKVLLWVAVGYTLMPFDLIPDFIPVIGHLDDAVIVPLLVVTALRFIPAEVIEDCRRKSDDSHGSPK